MVPVETPHPPRWFDMAIRPPSDIVLDVARAANPMRYEEASAKLKRLGGPEGATSFDDVFGGFGRGARAATPLDPATAMMRFRTTAVVGRSASCSAADGIDPRKAAAYHDFEAMMLKTTIESMLPPDSEAVYGEGLAGDVWRSQLAEQVATQMASAGGIGIADRLVAADRSSARSAPRTVDELADGLAAAGARTQVPDLAGTASSSIAAPLRLSPAIEPDTDTLL